jgi:hypothetical protein
MTQSAPHFSLGFLFRATTCAAMLLAWGSAIASASPDVIGWTITAIGAVLGFIVGYRRAGSRLSGVFVAAGFILGSLFVAGYSAYVAIVYQSPPQGFQSKIEANDFSATTAIVLWTIPTPLILFTLIQLLRAWTWSAHDSQMRRERMSANAVGESPA